MVTTPHVRAELIAHAPEGVAPGAPVWVGLQITHQPEWHTYWKNAGDSGLPTELAWTLPAGVTAGDIAWPVPKKIPIGNLANYGYEGTVLLPVPLTIAPDFKPRRRSPAQTSSTSSSRPPGWSAARNAFPKKASSLLKLPLQGSTALHKARLRRGLGRAAGRRSRKPGAIADRRRQAAGPARQACRRRCAARRWSSSPRPAEVIHTAAVRARTGRRPGKATPGPRTVPLAGAAQRQPRR